MLFLLPNTMTQLKLINKSITRSNQAENIGFIICTCSLYTLGLLSIFHPLNSRFNLYFKCVIVTDISSRLRHAMKLTFLIPTARVAKLHLIRCIGQNQPHVLQQSHNRVQKKKKKQLHLGIRRCESQQCRNNTIQCMSYKQFSLNKKVFKTLLME